MRIVFFGSPDFAVPSLIALLEAGHDVALVVSQPAKPVGRKAVLTDPPVARAAAERGLARFQPKTLKDDDAFARLKEVGADLFVVVAYGKILSQRVLDLPRLGCVNVHGSVLPRWRGASPVQAALLHGDLETGISIMQMDAGMDTGPVHAIETTPIDEDEDAASLSERLAALGAALLLKTLPTIEKGDVAPTSQDASLATTCPKIHREDGLVDWTRSDLEIVNRSRAFSPWPGLFSFRSGARLKLASVRRAAGTGEPGTVLSVSGDGMVVACGQGAVSIGTLQLEGKKALPAAEFARGERVLPGDSLR